MRIPARLMNFVCAHAPAAVRKRGLEILLRDTAEAFRSPVPVTTGVSFDESLLEFARFTRRESEKLRASDTDMDRVSDRIFRGGENLGIRIRRAIRIKSTEQAVSAMNALYGAIGIEAAPAEPDGITVSRCFFSATYTPETCSFISALDDGVFSGLSGGGRLIFRSRITEGAPCCQCDIIPAKEAG